MRGGWGGGGIGDRRVGKGLASRGVHLRFRDFVIQKAHQDFEHREKSLLLHIEPEHSADHVRCRQSWRHSATPHALTQVGGCVIRRGRSASLTALRPRKRAALAKYGNPGGREMTTKES